MGCRRCCKPILSVQNVRQSLPIHLAKSRAVQSANDTESPQRELVIRGKRRLLHAELEMSFHASVDQLEPLLRQKPARCTDARDKHRGREYEVRIGESTHC